MNLKKSPLFFLLKLVLEKKTIYYKYYYYYNYNYYFLNFNLQLNLVQNCL